MEGWLTNYLRAISAHRLSPGSTGRHDGPTGCQSFVWSRLIARAKDALERTEGHGACEVQTIAPEDEGTNGSIEAPATQEMKNEHIVPLYTKCKLSEYGVTTRIEPFSTSTAASLPPRFA